MIAGLEANDKAMTQRAYWRQEKEQMYRETTERINEYKQRKELRLREGINSRNEKYLTRKEKQAADYVRIKQEQVQSIQDLREQLAQKALRERPSLYARAIR